MGSAKASKPPVESPAALSDPVPVDSALLQEACLWRLPGELPEAEKRPLTPGLL